MKSIFTDCLAEHLEIMRSIEAQADLFAEIAEKMVHCINAGHKICWMGNGGSAADSQHLAAELVGRFQIERRGLPSIAFTTDTSILTAVANDYGYDAIFERQVESLCQPGDLLVGLSTSGNSPNVLRAMEKARNLSISTIGLAGKDGGKLKDVSDLCFVVPSPKAARTQEAHIFLGHCFCEAIESQLKG